MMIKLTVRTDWQNQNSWGDNNKAENLTIDNCELEETLSLLWHFNYREGDNFTLGELLEILITEGADAISRQIGINTGA